MGRPLKIAKAQAVVTLTATNGTTEVVTTSANFTNLGIIAGMTFIPASNVGNLVAGTTYWILEVINSGNNSTFTVSATDLSANPTFTKFNLGTTAAQSVALTVNVVDAYFNNPVSGDGYPATNTSTYSVVGGNTSIYGKQVLVSVAIGRTGNGTIYGDTGNTNIYGQDTDLANTLSVGSAVQVAVANVNGSTDYVDIGFVSSVTGYITVAVANTTATGNIIGTSGNAETLFVGAPVTFDANTGGLTTGTVYFVDTIANAAAFTVASSQYGPQVQLTTGTDVSNATIDVAVLTANATANFTNADYVYANDEAGYIVRQKGKQKYLVTGTTTGLTAPCFTANVANTALTPNTMSIIATYANSSTTRVQSLSDHTLEIFGTGNVLPNSTPAFATFNTAYAADTYGGQPYPIVTINNA